MHNARRLPVLLYVFIFLFSRFFCRRPQKQFHSSDFFALFSHVWPNPTDFSVIYSDSIIRIQLRLLQALADST